MLFYPPKYEHSSKQEVETSLTVNLHWIVKGKPSKDSPEIYYKINRVTYSRFSDGHYNIILNISAERAEFRKAYLAVRTSNANGNGHTSTNITYKPFFDSDGVNVNLEDICLDKKLSEMLYNKIGCTLENIHKDLYFRFFMQDTMLFKDDDNTSKINESEDKLYLSSDLSDIKLEDVADELGNWLWV